MLSYLRNLENISQISKCVESKYFFTTCVQMANHLFFALVWIQKFFYGKFWLNL